MCSAEKKQLETLQNDILFSFFLLKGMNYKFKQGRNFLNLWWNLNEGLKIEGILSFNHYHNGKSNEKLEFLYEFYQLVIRSLISQHFSVS